MLNQMEFISKHGACEHEYQIEQKFVVDVYMYSDCVLDAGASDNLTLTVNYAEAYDVIAQIMYGDHVDLLETLGFKIGTKLIEKFEVIDKVKVEVRKMQPPIPGFNGTAAIELIINR